MASSSGDIHPPDVFFENRDRGQNENDFRDEDQDEDEDEEPFAALRSAPPKQAPSKPISRQGSPVVLPPVLSNPVSNAAAGSVPGRSRFAIIRDRNPGVGALGIPLQPHLSSGALGNNPFESGTSGWRLGQFRDSKIPASIAVIGIALVILYVFTPSFVTLPATAPFDTPQVSHVHVLLVAIAAGILTFALQFFW
jgi:hypothetical protein